MSDKCLVRVEKLLKKSSIRSSTKEEIINAIKIAQAEAKLTSIESFLENERIGTNILFQKPIICF